nr:alpha-amylase [Oscillospiraceae bacterium]
MAHNTDIRLRDQVIYSIYVRCHTEEGTFNAIHADLDRIRGLGTDIIWFMPIHPIGVKNKKGSLGCPYANRDYRTVNPEYGTMEDFRRLVDAIHDKGMKCIIDVVYNHTSPDSTLVQQHPEFFYHKPDGSLGNHVGEWTDVVDLDYTCRELWDYQIESLKMWAGIVDGFRCDVASMVDVEFWCKARAAVEEVHPGCIWLAETYMGSFALLNRQMGLYSCCDYEMFRAFDMEYEYDIRDVFERYLKGEGRLSNYMDVMNFQECQYPDNYIKMRFLENHDQPRICHFIKDGKILENFTAFLYFLKGSTLLYAGQEFCCDQTPSLFEKDVFPRNTGRDISAQLAKLNQVKKEILSCEDIIQCSADDENDIAILLRSDTKIRKLGIFSLKAKAAAVAVSFPDGTYINHLDGSAVQVADGHLLCLGNPIVITCAEH